jgi:hypothetical protein
MESSFSQPQSERVPFITVSTAPPNDTPQGSSPKPEQVFLESFKCTSHDKTVKPERRQQIPRSGAFDKNRKSFLDLAGELRNDVYFRLLVVGEVGIEFDKSIKKVPCLVPLLQTCRQIHDEAGGVFYAHNSFRCSQYRMIFLDPGRSSDMEGTNNIPAAALFLMPTVGNMFFPAPRYHTWLTRLSIHATVIISSRRREIAGEMVPDDPRITKLDDVEAQMDEKISSAFRDVYTKIKTRWEEKDRLWEGESWWYADRVASRRAHDREIE